MTPNSKLKAAIKAAMSNEMIVTGNTSSTALYKALDNDALLSLLPSETALNTKYKKPIVKSIVGVGEGVEGTPPVLGTYDDPVFVTQAATFDKVETVLAVTNEIIQDSQIDIMSYIDAQIGMAQSIHLQERALNHETFGICNGLIDRSNNFAEAEEDDQSRSDNIYKVHFSGIAGSWGADADSVSQFILSVIEDVPSRYQNDIALYMGKDAWFEIMNAFTAIDPSNNLVTDVGSLTFKGYPVVILDNLPSNANGSDCFFVGSIQNAYQFVPLANSEEHIVEDVTIKGQQVIYDSMRYSFVPLDNTAIRVALKYVDPTP